MSKRRPTRKRSDLLKVSVEKKPEPMSVGFQVGTTALILVTFGSFLFHPINLTDSDLGRHLKNGELFLQSAFIASTNLYSYTTPDHPFVNHHWGTGVVFYLIERVAGFHGLSLFLLAMSLASLWLFLHLAAKYSSFALAALLAIVVMPVLISRYEVRPEIFSYFLSGVFLHMLWDYKYGKLGLRRLFLLPGLQILWVNLHIYFFIGMALVAVYLLESFAKFAVQDTGETLHTRDQCKGLAAILFLTFCASCINPAGVYGAVYPLFILQGYGFPVIENYSVGAILKAGFAFLPLVYFQIVFGTLCLSWIYAVMKDRSNLSLANFFLSVFSSAMAWWTIRNFVMFAYFALPLTAVNLRKSALGPQSNSSISVLTISGAAAGVAILLVLINPVYFFGVDFGFGLKAENPAAADFFHKEKLQGPIFNNFDVGGYLIYYLYPRQRVFVDNRPEAYPPSFFGDDYFSVLMNDERWRASAQQHRFNVIFMNHRGGSAVAERFIVRRVLDPDWAPVFFDADIIILVRRHDANHSVIAKHELPKEAVLQRMK
jgi:hypothetical protein